MTLSRWKKAAPPRLAPEPPSSTWVRRADQAARAARFIAWTLAALTAAVLFQPVIFADSVRPVVKVAMVLLACVAWLRPADALLVVAAFIPIADVTASLLRSPGFGTEPLVLAFVAPWLIRHGRWPAAGSTAAGLTLPAALLAVAVAASALVDLIALQPRHDYPGPYVWSLLEVLATRPLNDPAHFPVVRVAIVFMAGLALFVATVTLGMHERSLNRRLAAMLVVGASGAAALNLQRLAGSALRSTTPLAAFREYLGTVRVNVHYTDFNAAGSYFVALLLVALALAIAARRRGAVWLACAAVIAGALWLTGSRAALVSAALGLAAGIVLPAMRARSGWGRRVLAAGLLLVFVVGAALLVVRPFRYFQSDVRVALHVRAELARASLRMTGAAPVFGVGLGHYSQRVREFVSPDLATLFPSAPRENAHNNFLQILAELGITGFVLFVWILGTALVAAVVAARTSGARDAVLGGLLAGLLAFLLTCLVGHPLLTREVAYTFWILLGLTTAYALACHVSAFADATPQVQLLPMPHAPWRATAVAGLMLLLVLSIPFRARAALRNAELEHAALGTSEWQSAVDGTPFRWAGNGALFFVPADARTIEIPLSGDDNQRPVGVEIRLDGRLADRVLLGPTGWRSVKLLMPPNRSPRRFASLELFLSPAATPEPSTIAAPEVTSAPRIKVGKIMARW